MEEETMASYKKIQFNIFEETLNDTSTVFIAHCAAYKLFSAGRTKEEARKSMRKKIDQKLKNRTSLLELAGILSNEEAEELKRNIREMRGK
ncbi:MAG: hypothetical protein OXR66_04520 [Candidatus Woesearchaeota archaeon]|nr:hypothetical protein [Candidatus Woesearchaeota archaeon]